MGVRCLLILSALFAANATISNQQTNTDTVAQLGANPIRKIVTLLQDMQKEIEAEGAKAGELYDKFMCFCQGGAGELQKSIDDAAQSITQSSATEKEQSAEKAGLEQDLIKHKADRVAAGDDLEKATALRGKENSEYETDIADQKANYAAISGAIPSLEKGLGGASLLQSNGPGLKKQIQKALAAAQTVSEMEKKDVMAFLESKSDSESGAPGTDQIVGILKNMKDEMEKDLGEMQSQETKDHESFNELKAAKLEEISLNEKAVIEKEKRIGGLALELSESNHALEDSQEEKANAEKFKANMKEQCATVEQDRDMRAKMRAEEIKAVSEAVNILNDDDALEVFSKAKSAALVQQPKANYDALIQLINRPGLHIKASHRHHHLALLGVQQKIKRAEPNTGDSAEKLVVGMVDGMVGVLHDEDVGDEHKKEWCFNETQVAHGIESSKKDHIQKTETEIAEQEDQLATTVAEIKSLTENIQMTDKMVHEATEQRKAEHQDFVDSFATSATALRLIDKAIKRLEKFYSPEKFAKEKKAATDAALAKAGLSLSQKRPDAALVQKMANQMLPGGFDALIQTGAESQKRFSMKVRDGVDPVSIPTTPGTYEKKESGGVMGLMNEFKTDLKTDMTESETSEKFMAKDYVRIMSDAQASRKQDVKSLNEKKSAKATLDQKLVDNKAMLALTEEQLHNLQLYLVQLHTECDFLMRNFESRHEGRVDEESGLEDAETIVTDAAPPNHKEIEKRFEEEKTDDHVDKHFPGTPIDDGPDH